MYQHESAACGPDHPPDLGAHVGVRRDRRAHRGASGSRDLGRDEADPSDVDVAVGAGESQSLGQLGPHDVPVEQSEPASAVFQ